MNIGLIIQGPVLSGGFTGKTHGSGRTRASKNSLVNFDSTSSINQNITIAQDYFSEIVVSTWENQDTENIKGKCKIIKSIDPTPNPPSTRKPIEDFPDFNKINKIRQFYSVFKGLNHLEKMGIEHVIKIRTDQTLDLKLLFNDYSFFLESSNKKFMIPFLTDDEPWSIPDFYIGGRISDFNDLVMLMINEKFEFHKNVHRDLFFKGAFINSKFFKENCLSEFFVFRDYQNKNLSKILDISRDRIWSPASKELYNSLIWRGEPISISQKPRKIFANEETATKLNITDQMNIDWNLFLRTTTGSGSLLRFNLNYVSFKVRKLYLDSRSNFSSILDKLSNRFLFKVFDFSRFRNSRIK